MYALRGIPAAAHLLSSIRVRANTSRVSVRLPMEFMDIEKRQRLVQAKNKEGRTPLHLAVAYVGGVAAVAGDVGVMSAVQVRWTSRLHRVACFCGRIGQEQFRMQTTRSTGVEGSRSILT